MKAEVEQKILAMLRQYERIAGLEGIGFEIHPVSFNGPAYLDFLYDEETGVAGEFKILINTDYLNHRFLGLSICHELGHVINIKKQGTNKNFIEPDTTWQWIIVEISADREAFKIYEEPRKKDSLYWLAEKVWITLHNLRNKQYKDFIHKQLAVGIARLLAASVA